MKIISSHCNTVQHYGNYQETSKPQHLDNAHQSSLDWIGLCSVLRPRQHSIGYTGDGFYMSKDPTNSIKVIMLITWYDITS